MQIHFTSSTIQAYENKTGSMDLFFNPIIIFEDMLPAQLEILKDLTFCINSTEIGEHVFAIEFIKAAIVKGPENQLFVEFRLSKRDVKFIYDNYVCEITFSAKLEGKELISKALGIVKTKFSKGLV